jgi:predicted ATP-dependent serine protease
MYNKYDDMKSQRSKIMAKVKTTFSAKTATSYAKWQGQCNACKEWNTIAEEIIQKQEKTAWKERSLHRLIGT